MKAIFNAHGNWESLLGHPNPCYPPTTCMSMLASFLEDALAVEVKTDGIDIGGNIIKLEDGFCYFVSLYLSVFTQEAKAYFMADAVVYLLVERLGNVLIKETIALGSVRYQVQQMQIKLKRIPCFLKDADKRQDEDASVRNWVSEIGDAAFDIEDVIDSFVLEFAPRNGRRIHNPITKGMALQNLVSKIDEIKSQIIDLTRSLQTYGITARNEGEGTSLAFERQRQLRWSYSHVVEEYIVGFNEDIRQPIA
ncbi:hypothetical protein SLEP1_g58245 [Rubroshorea leprosula]|uniref:Disease resistance N-terminal domain-containing protein n=1 Tax=Rubroshorea leprosula TaxID=152421 RepID=A0AAV5MNX8_9ROSI|nr:hypothetical protein SLEP1_g58245 [Rubroshorea leprosula]